jgi:hypothetical protein
VNIAAATSMAKVAGVDFITHAPVDRVISDQKVNQILNKKRVSSPTLAMIKSGIT